MPKPSKTEVLPKDAAPRDPAWDGIRHTIASVRAAGRAYLFGQAWLGWQLWVLKKAHGVKRGGDRKSNGQVGRLIFSWDQTVEAETGMKRRTADRFIQLFEATRAKLKRAKKDAANQTALALFESENPLALPPEQRESLQDVIASLCDGETQASLMEELNVVPKPAPPPNGKKRSGKDKESPEQLAFHFWDGPASAIVKARSASDYKKLLHMLPPTTEEEGKVSLVFLRDEVAALLEDLNEALSLHLKPVNRKS